MKRHIAQIAGLALLSTLFLNCTAMAGKSMELRSANTYFNQNDKEQALEWYEKAAAKDTREAQVYARLVELYADKKRWPEMSKAFAKLDGCADKPGDLKKFKEDARSVIDKLRMGFWNGSIEQSKAADSLRSLGDSAAARDHFEQARVRTRLALDLLPDLPEFTQRNDKEKLPLRSDFTKRLGDLYINEFNSLYASEEGFSLLNKASESYGQLVATFPDSTDYAVTLAQLSYNVRDFNQARAVIDKALERHGENGDLLNYAGKVRIQQALAMKNDKGEVSAAGKKLMGEATDFLKQAIALDPNDLQQYYNLALLYRDIEDPHRALEYFSTIETRMADQLAASAAQESGKPADSIDKQTIFSAERLKTLPDEQRTLLFDSWYSMAVLYFQDLPEAEQDVKKAALNFERCLLLQPDNKGLKFNLGVALVRSGDKAQLARGKKLMEEGGGGDPQ